MADLIALWHDEHVRFARLLDLLDAQIAAFHEGEATNYTVMRDIVTYLRSYAQVVHHPREDAAFDRLVLREPALQLPVNRLLQEHRVIAFAGEELVALLNEVVADAMVSRAAIEAAAAQYLAYYRHHIGTEERDIMPRARRLLTPEDWAVVAGAAPSASDPLFGDTPSDTYRELREFMASRDSAD
jgi:hemerythrin-like domain-containing protein